MESEPNRKMHYYWAIDGAKKDGKITDANDVLLQHHMSRLLNVEGGHYWSVLGWLAAYCKDATAVQQARDNPMDYYVAWFKAELAALEAS